MNKTKSTKILKSLEDTFFGRMGHYFSYDSSFGANCDIPQWGYVGDSPKGDIASQSTELHQF